MLTNGFPKALALIIASAFVTGGCGPKPSSSVSFDKSEVGVQLKHFVGEKKAQALADATVRKKELHPGIKRLFAAAEKGDTMSVSNNYFDLKSRAPHYNGNTSTDEELQGVQWQIAKEVFGAFDCLESTEGDSTTVGIGRDIIDSIPVGSIYFGGTDPGRWVVTSLQKSHVHADPFFTLTQNAMADPGYLDYARSTYGARIYIPTPDDSQKCFQDYADDAQRRKLHDETRPNEAKQISPGEDVRGDASGHVQVSGQIAVMSVNAALVKVVFDHETNREFYVEESFPLDWMYPHLEPHGWIMKINRGALAQLSEDMIRKDHEFWSQRMVPVIGDWLKEDTSVQEICAFVEKVYVRSDLTGFKGNPRIISDDWPKWMSKMRSSIAGVYMWRMGSSPSGTLVPTEFIAQGEAWRRMSKEADFAFRQAFAICPGSPEVVFRYVQFLVNDKRVTDALAVAELAKVLHKGEDDENQFQQLLNSLKNIHL